MRRSTPAFPGASPRTFTGAGEKGRLLYGSGGPKLTLATTWGDMEIQRVTGVYAEMVGG